MLIDSVGVGCSGIDLRDLRDSCDRCAHVWSREGGRAQRVWLVF